MVQHISVLTFCFVFLLLCVSFLQHARMTYVELKCSLGKLCCSKNVFSFSSFCFFAFVFCFNYCNYQGYITSLVPFPPPQHNFHVHSHLWPQLKFMKSPQCWGLLGWRPSQERNELIVTLRLLLSISELSTAVDRRCPGPRPSITGPIIRRQNK